MLAADIGPAIAPSLSSDSAVVTTQSTASTIKQSAQTSSHLVIVDSEMAGLGQWQDAVPQNATIVLLHPSEDPIGQLSQIVNEHRGIDSMHIISHGADGELRLAGQAINQQILIQRATEIQSWSQSFAEGADVLIYGCDVAAGDLGVHFVERLASLLDVDVAASTNLTGSSIENYDWVLEHQVGSIQYASLLNQRVLDRVRGHLAIEIWAAGQTTDELMELEIDGEVVETWFVRDTDATNNQFLPYFYNVDGISADQIRINFVNDLFDPENGVDRNLRIDKIVVDGVTYETEDPSVFSTGTWKPSDGVTPGNRQSEYLTNNGYLQFSEAGGNTGGGANGSTITINASGETGSENMQLLIDGNVVQTFTDISTDGGSYTFTADQTVTADRVRVAFINDEYLPQAGVDRNLRVDNIVIDGAISETESPSTFSTGSFVDGQGIIPGNWQSETLHSNGYFQFNSVGSPNPGNSGSFSLVTSEVTIVESQGSVTLEVARIGGSDGAATIDIFTADENANSGQDYIENSTRLFFGDGETSKTFTVNLINDGVAEATEQFSVRIDNPQGANLLAPRTSLITILDDDSGLPRFTSFDSAAGLSLNGSAQVVDSELELTSAARQQAGTAFFQSPIAVDSNTSFQSQFAFRIGGGSGTNGADGLAFLIQNSAAGLEALGRPGGYIGYDTIENSVAIEFDNYLKGGPGASSIAVMVNGTTPITEVSAGFDLNDGQQYYAWVDYNGNSNNLAVYLSRTPDKPSFATLKTNIALDEILGNSAFAGFAGGNFNQPNFHRVSQWNFSLDTPPADPPTIPTGEIVERDIYTGLNQPLAVQWSPDGRNIFVGEKGGVIKVARDGASNLQTLIDISAQVNNISDRGLVDFAVDPNFQSNGYIYLLYTYDPPEVFDNVGNAFAGPDGQGNRAGRLLRVQADAATGFTTLVSGSETVLLGKNSTWDNFNAFVDSTSNFSEPEAGRTAGGGYVEDFIKSDSLSHTVGSLAFGLDGSLFVSIGDGASYNQVDRRALSVQNLNSLSGKVLRIDPNTGQGLSDNPFFDGNPNSNQSRVYQLGLRNPWRLTVDEVSGQLYIGETGLASFEELNTGGPGTNFGWPFYEGSQGVNNPTPGYRDLPQAQAFYNSGQGKPASIALRHQAGSNVIVLGDIVYDIDLGSQFDGHVFFADLYRGGVAHAPIGPDGEPFNAQTLLSGAEFVVDIQQGPDNSLYYVNLLEGTVGKWQRV